MRETLSVETDGARMDIEVGTKTIEAHAHASNHPERWAAFLALVRRGLLDAFGNPPALAGDRRSESGEGA